MGKCTENKLLSAGFNYILIGLCITISTVCLSSDVNPIEENLSKGLKGWEEKIFNRKTIYSVETLNNQNVLKAVSNNSASGLFKKININLKKYPYLSWKWKIKKKLKISNEKTKDGDDYAARLYVISKSRFFFWETKSLCYVWSNSKTENSCWGDPFALNNVIIVPVSDSNDKIDTWYTIKRNVFEDFKKYFHETFDSINDIAIMTDTDNSHEKTTAYYSDIFFSK